MIVGQRIGYIRVSTNDQNTARQQAEMAKLGLDQIFEDHASGKNTVDRPELAEMLRHVRERDEVFVVSMDRLARNLEDLLRLVKELQAKGVTIHFLKENLTLAPGNDNPMSKMLLAVMGAVAEFERALIRERQREGIEQAKARGVYAGRKPIDKEKIAEAMALLQEGHSKQAVAKRLNIARATLYRYLPAVGK